MIVTLANLELEAEGESFESLISLDDAKLLKILNIRVERRDDPFTTLVMSMGTCRTA